MKKIGKFAVSLTAAGYLSQGGQAAVFSPQPVKSDDRSVSLFKILRGEHTYTLAGHRSHSSHRSHGSHRSHRSSSGGSYFGGRHTSESTPPASVLPRPPQAPRVMPSPSRDLETMPLPSRPLKILPGNSEKFTRIVRQVQTALYAYGYYTGIIDGKFGPETRTALSKFQKDWNLKVTGTITPEVLDALQIVAK